MKKLGKKISTIEGTLTAFGCTCNCTGCVCRTSQCTCRTNPMATHRNALTNSGVVSNSMSWTGMMA